MAWVEEQVEHRRLPGGEIGAGRRGRKGEGGWERVQGGEGGGVRDEGRGMREIGRDLVWGAWGCRELELLIIDNVV